MRCNDEQEQEQEQTSGLPKHIAIIMDGNNRWAKRRGLRGAAGHKEGAKAVKETVKNCVRLGIEALTVFAFSSENWRRPKEEVELLMQLFLESLNSEVEELYANGVRLRFVGDLSLFSEPLQKGMRSAMAYTENNRRLTFNVAVNYGGAGILRKRPDPLPVMSSVVRYSWRILMNTFWMIALHSLISLRLISAFEPVASGASVIFYFGKLLMQSSTLLSVYGQILILKH